MTGILSCIFLFWLQKQTILLFYRSNGKKKKKSRNREAGADSSNAKKGFSFFSKFFFPPFNLTAGKKKEKKIANLFKAIVHDTNCSVKLATCGLMLVTVDIHCH